MAEGGAAGCAPRSRAARVWKGSGLRADFWCAFSFSVVLWLGDLNYRLEDLDVAKVKQLVDEKAFLELCQYDQVPMSHLPAGGAEGAG